MQTPLRLLREEADAAPNQPPPFSPREMERRNRIMATSVKIFARYGRATVTLGSLARTLRLCPSALRRHFADLDELLSEILHRHLASLSSILADVPRDLPDRPAALREAYFNATRTGLGSPVSCHLLLIRDRHLLPRDLLDSIEETHRGIGEMMAGENAIITLILLDTPEFMMEEIEAGRAAILEAYAARIARHVAMVQRPRPAAGAPEIHAGESAATPEQRPEIPSFGACRSFFPRPQIYPNPTWTPSYLPDNHLMPPKRSRAGPN